MIKSKELIDPKSCLNKAGPDEMLFVLLERDPAARVAISAWMRERIRIGKNLPDDAQIAEAIDCMDAFAVCDPDQRKKRFYVVAGERREFAEFDLWQQTHLVYEFVYVESAEMLAGVDPHIDAVVFLQSARERKDYEALRAALREINVSKGGG